MCFSQKLDNMYAQLLDADDRRLLAEDALQQIRNERKLTFVYVDTLNNAFYRYKCLVNC